MISRRAVPHIIVAVGLVAGLVAIGLLSLAPSARALPPAGTETLNVTGEVSITSRLGEETIALNGTFTIRRDDPRMDGDVEVVDTEIVALGLQGDSITGPVTVTQSETRPSLGEIRSLQPPPDQFPASSFFDAFVSVAVPASPQPTLAMHNEEALHLVPMSEGSEVSLSEWPPVGAQFVAEPDPCVPLLRDDLDRRVPQPELPAGICVTSVSIEVGVEKTPTPTSTPCPLDACTPTATPSPTNTPCPVAVCPPTPTTPPTPTATPTAPPLPEDPTFSVAAGGPSGRHPAELLGADAPVLGPSGNDNFADAWEITGFPFTGSQSTLGMTTEPGEPLNPAGCVLFEPNVKGATVWYRFTAPSSSTMAAETAGSDFDTVLALYTGNALDTLNVLGCDDDSGPGLQSEMSFPVTAGATYYLQAGGFSGRMGNLVLNVSLGGGGAAGQASSGQVSCANLGLTTDGCDDGSDGDQDDLNAISFGVDFAEGDGALAFSVAPGSVGLGNSGVAQQAACSPAQPQADEFITSANGTNALFFDGDGENGACPTTYALNLTELPVSDDLDALNEEPPSFVDTDNDGALEEPVFLSLAAGSPSLASSGRSAADILWTIGFQPGLYASASTLGLQPGDDIDGLCLADRGTGPQYDADSDVLLFSLAVGSPTLDDLGASPADLLSPGPQVVIGAGQIGLRVSDDLNAVKCFAGADPTRETVVVGDTWFCGSVFQGGVCETVIDVGMTVVWDFSGAALPHTVTECGASCDSPTASPLWDSGVVDDGSTFEFAFDEPGEYLYRCTIHPTLMRGVIIVIGAGDVNCNGSIDSIDAALVLQLTAGLVGSLSCEQNADANGDGSINAVDAALILQFGAGLLDQLPP